MKRKLIAGILAFTMLLSAAGCGKKAVGQSNTTAAGGSIETEDVRNLIFVPSDITFDGFKGDIIYEAVHGDSLIVCTSEYQMDEEMIEATFTDAMEDSDSAKSIFRVYSVPTTGGTAKLLLEDQNNDCSINNVFDVQGNVGLWLNSFNEKGDDASTILVLDKEGNKVKEFDISFIYGEGYPTSVMYFMEEDIVLTCYDETVKGTDSKGKEKFSLATNGYLMSAGLTKDGVPVVYIYNNDKEELKTIDIKNGSYKDTVVPENGLAAADIRPGVGEYDIVFSTRNYAYGFNLAQNEVTKLCDYTASDIDASSIMNGLVLDEESIIVELYDNRTGENTFEAYKKIKPEDYVEKKELKLMCLYAPSELRSMVIAFNKSHTDCRVNIIDYSEYENTYERMAADIGAGNYADIYYLNDGIGNFSVEQCIAKGMFEDLTPYLEKDPDVSPDDLIPSIYKAAQVDGKTYYVGGHFTIRALIGNKQDLGDRKGWTFEEFKEYVDSKPADAKLFSSSSKGDILGYFLSSSMGDFVDWEKGECYFDTPEFKSVLELSNRGTDEEELNWDETSVLDLATGKQLFMEGYLNLDEMAMYDGFLSGKATYIGYPNKDKEGIYASINDSLAISSVCSDKDAAWEFVKQIISKDYQSIDYWNANFGCPTRKDMFETYLKTFTAKEDYTDEFGNYIYAREGVVGMNDVETSIKPLTDAEVQVFRDQVDSVSRIWSTDSSLYEIICEEAGAYFAGDKTLDETAALIQNRASTYVQENK